MLETWKAVVNYEGIYEVSDQGRVRSLDRLSFCGRKLKGKILSNKIRLGRGYVGIRLSYGVPETRYVHQLVTAAFFGPCPDKKEVCHGPKGILDNSITNLRYGTRSENQQDRVRDGTSRSIPIVRSDGVEFDSATQAAIITGCNRSDITACCKGRRYKTIGGFKWGYK